MSRILKQALDLCRAGQHRRAVPLFNKILATHPDHPTATFFLGLATWHQETSTPEERQQGLELMRRAVDSSPRDPALQHNFATVVAGLGQIDEADGYYRRAIDLKPDYAEAYFNFAGIHRFSTGDPLIQAMRSLYAAGTMNNDDTEFLCYALSKALDDTGCFDEAMHFCLEGSRLSGRHYDVTTLDRALAELRAAIPDAELLRPRPGRGSASEEPLFIVGMPSSGTTLVEQILSRHPQVYAGGELPVIGEIERSGMAWATRHAGYSGGPFAWLGRVPDPQHTSAAEAVLQMVRRRAGRPFTRYTDKMPENVLRLGLISLLFPRARIIHVRRHPLDTCVSNLFQRFTRGQAWSFRMDWLGRRYRLCHDVMTHWRAVTPLRILDVKYEEVTADLEGAARRMIDFAGLPWDDACLAPEEGGREVRTASRWQVRQPVYSSSVERWRRYEAWLAPLIEALGGMEEITRMDAGE